MVKIIKLLIIFILFFTAPAAQAEPISTSLGISLAAAYALVASAAMAAVSAAVSITMGVVQTNQQKAMLDYQRKVNEQNAKASKEAAQAKIENQRRQARFIQGTQLARLGGMGALAEGSPLNIMGQTAGQQEYDNMVTKYEGDVQSIQFQQQATLNKYQSDIADYNLGLNTTSTVVKAAGSISNSLLGGTTGGVTGTVTGISPSITSTGTTASSSAGYVGTLPTIGK